MCLFQVDFPAITICTQGRIEENLEVGFYNQFLEFLNENNKSVDISAISFRRAIRRVLFSQIFTVVVS
jgi:hypothetical protein